MPEDVGPCMCPATSMVRRLHRAMHHSYSYRLVVGGDVANEYSPIGRGRSLRPQVFDDCAAGFRREWENVGATALTLGQPQRPCLPINIVQLQVYNLTGTQPEIG